MQAKTEIAAEVKDKLTKSMASFGFMIIETLVRTACPHKALLLRSSVVLISLLVLL